MIIAHRLLACSFLTLLWAIFLPSCFSGTFAQETPLTQAERFFNQGYYEDALEIYQKVSGEDRIAASIGASRTLVMTGRYQEAENLCRKRLAEFSGEVGIATELSEILVMTGRSEEALKVLNTATARPEATIRSLVQYGRILKLKGNHQAAETFFELAIGRYNEGLVYEVEDIAMVAVAARELESFQDANLLFREASRVQPNNSEIQVLWGNLFLAKYNQEEALTSFQTVLQQNERYVPALAGLGKILNGEKAKSILEKALAINENSLLALETLARIEIEDDKYAEALSTSKKVISINPESLEARSLLAAIALLTQDGSSYQSQVRWMEDFSPNNGHFYEKIAEILSRKYRFAEAVSLAQKALQTDPELWNAQTILGTNLLHLGREEEGRRYLEDSFNKDPFNHFTKNMLSVLDLLEDFETRQTRNFLVRMHKSEADILWPYLEPFLQEAWDTLTKKYAFVPETPILIEIFHQNEDFAARTIGLPDIGPLVGVCFGKVITMTSPITLKKSGYANWKEILWHEFVHVITLQMTNHRLPRWLSEGISVFEENQGRPEWGRNQDLDLVKAVRNDHFLSLDRLNEGFTRATSSEDLNLAYYQSSLVVAYLVERYGFKALLSLLQEYKTQQRMDTIFQNVFKQPLSVVENGFLAWASQQAKRVNIYVDQQDPNDKSDGHGHGMRHNSLSSLAERMDMESVIAEMQERVKKQPRDFMAHFQLGMVFYLKGQQNEAIPYLETARDLLPEYGGTPSPYQILAEIYQKQGNQAAALKELEKWVTFQQHTFEAPFQLAKAALQKKNEQQALYYLQRAIDVNPYDFDIHKTYAELTLKRGDYPSAIREYKILVQLDQTDPVKAQTDLADALLKGGKKAEAKDTILAALELAPTYERAQVILLDSLEP